MGHGVVIPYTKLAPDIRQAVIEEFVTREGTDYGLHEHSLAEKHAAVVKQLERGEVVIIFDPETESVTLVPFDELPSEA